MGFLTTWAADGGRTPAAVARMATYALSGAQGVTGPTHLKLVPLGGGTVGLTPGSALVHAGTTGVRQWQTYVVGVESTDGDATATVPMPVSTQRVLHAVVVVPDPEWAGVPEPPDPLTFAYAELRLLTEAEVSALTAPFLPVATVTIPANAGNITAEMIDDSPRVIAVPKVQRHLFVTRLSTGQEDPLTTNPEGETWPNVTHWVTVPPWANKARVLAILGGVYFPGTGNFTGHLWARVGSPAVGGVQTAVSRIQTPEGGESRQTLVCGGNVDIPPEIRGKYLTCYTVARGDEGTSGHPVLRAASTVSLEVEFYEETE